MRRVEAASAIGHGSRILPCGHPTPIRCRQARASGSLAHALADQVDWVAGVPLVAADLIDGALREPDDVEGVKADSALGIESRIAFS